jgi:signal transduction histidine kinase
MPNFKPMTISLLPRFAPALEEEFQSIYYAGIRARLRLVSLPLAALFFLGLLLSRSAPAPYDLVVALPQIVFWLFVFALTLKSDAQRYWQPLLVGLGWLMAALVLWRLAFLLGAEIGQAPVAGAISPTNPQQRFYFMLHFAVLLVSLTGLRLLFGWQILLYGGTTLIGLAAYLSGLPLTASLYLDVRFAILPVLLIACVLLLAALVQEQMARRVFVANRQLLEERNDEKRRREATEGKLQVLAQAIGGIVHDLGNPLTTVQMGASTLDDFLDGGDTDKDTLKEFTAMIGDGAQMLNFLRLSLIEQTRVLEGKPTPVELKPVALRALVEAGAHFQKPRAIAGREVKIESPDTTVHADAMKLTTVFMNLIGNALKYSDGQVRVEWRACETSAKIIIAVLDGGTHNQGLTKEQATQLFTAFGRLEAHSQIEGTGLGLLSVQKIIEAHGGEAFIEGTEDGTPTSPRFSTARSTHPAMLREPYRTAFVVTCPQSSVTP